VFTRRSLAIILVTILCLPLSALAVDSAAPASKTTDPLVPDSDQQGYPPLLRRRHPTNNIARLVLEREGGAISEIVPRVGKGPTIKSAE